jgi:hypothetical protein
LRYLRHLPAWHPVPGVLPGTAHTVHSTAMVLAAKTVSQVITSTTAWITGILAVLATLMLTVGGVRYLMAGGDPAEVQKAKIALRTAAIGYGLAVLAPVIVIILASLTGGPH